ncbi:hypothetical protein AVEN_204794-1 [Araneus ventricosus]|uniref:Uncharacterized protein n=1 Tax=Araneus ventricosus TaxID=182803 RepID=A0A4Y2T395_ARAVE|nr:hypothetical protein AVEN_204794-1 [Araneus ventricosus]
MTRVKLPHKTRGRALDPQRQIERAPGTQTRRIFSVIKFRTRIPPATLPLGHSGQCGSGYKIAQIIRNCVRVYRGAGTARQGSLPAVREEGCDEVGLKSSKGLYLSTS